MIMLLLIFIHELSMALIWLYYGFAMNGILIKDSQKICRK